MYYLENVFGILPSHFKVVILWTAVSDMFIPCAPFHFTIHLICFNLHRCRIFCVLYRSFSMSLAKPPMRGLLAKRLRFHLPLAFGLALFAAATFKVSRSVF